MRVWGYVGCGASRERSEEGTGPVALNIKIRPVQVAFASVLLCALIAFPFRTSAQVMSLPGSLEVGNDGGAGYSVPIAVPPGTAGMTPSVSLMYSSRAGSGLAGVGWSLTGLPSIGRCPKTVAQDAVHGAVRYDLDDRFCLEGERLVLVSGTYGAANSEYRTEIEGFSKITAKGTAGNGPAWFQVKTKSGQTMEFGNTTNSRVLAQGKTTARVWGVNKITDVAGNYLTVTYTNDTTNGDAYPSRIDYTGNAGASLTPYNSVRFVYATRPDIVPLYHAGSLIKNTVRLTRIRTYEGSNVVADYRLTYDTSPSTSRSRLTSIKLCSGTSGSAPCLPETTFEWPNTSVDLPGALKASPAWAATYHLVPGDFSGTGRTGLLLQAKTASNASYLYQSDKSGTLVQVGTAIMGWDRTAYGLYTGDWRGTGKTGIALRSATELRFFESSGTGFSPLVLASQITPANAPLAFPDLNSDGVTDVVIGTSMFWTTPPAYRLIPLISNTDGTFSFHSFFDIGNPIPPGTFGVSSLYIGDWNGDGSPGVAFVASNPTGGPTVFCEWNGSQFMQMSFSPPGWGGPNTKFSIGDWNGDGKTDFVKYVEGSSTAPVEMYLSKGDGDFVQTAFSATGWGKFDIQPADWNGDGKTDLALVSRSAGVASRFYVASVTGESFDLLPFAPTNWTNSTLVLGDWNGIGTSSILRVPASGTNVYEYLSEPTSDLLISVTTGLGAKTEISYLPLTDDDVYEKETDAVYPVVDVQAPIYVVSSVSTDDGIGGTYATDYFYKGAKIDLEGRGFLGFHERRVTDPQTNIVATTEYLQTFPFTGVVASQTSKLGAQTLSSLSYDWDSTTLGTGNELVTLSESVEASWDLDGSAIPAVTTSYDYDAYGNATEIVVTTPDGTTKVTENTYANDTTNWRIGRLLDATVTNTVP